jgi:hypothetical protein
MWGQLSLSWLMAEAAVWRTVSDGTVLAVYPFYDGSWAVEVDHGTFVVRYGEVTRDVRATQPVR